MLNVELQATLKTPISDDINCMGQSKYIQMNYKGLATRGTRATTKRQFEIWLLHAKESQSHK